MSVATILLLAGLLGAGAWGLKSGAIEIAQLPAVRTLPTVAVGPWTQAAPTVLPTPYAPAALPAAIEGQAQVVPQGQIRIAATAVPPTGTPDPNMTLLVTLINSTPTQIVAGPPECNSVNATYHAKTTVVDEKGIPIGVTEGWSCESQAAAEAEMDRRADEMLGK